jgi:hypothetical protein
VIGKCGENGTNWENWKNGKIENFFVVEAFYND